jgi:hypothetical protein
MNRLPIELRYQILLNADLDSLYVLSQTDKTNYSIYNDDRFWIDKAVKDFNVTPDYFVKYHTPGPYLLYKFLTFTDRKCEPSYPTDGCLYQIGSSRQKDLIRYYSDVLGSGYNTSHNILIYGAAYYGALDDVLYIINRPRGHFPKNPVYVSLCRAAVVGRLDLVIDLTERYPDLGLIQAEGILKEAIKFGKLEVVKYLNGDGPKELPKRFYDSLPGFNRCTFDVEMLILETIKWNRYDILKYFTDKYISTQKYYPAIEKQRLIDAAIRVNDEDMITYLKLNIPDEEKRLRKLFKINGFTFKK